MNIYIYKREREKASGDCHQQWTDPGIFSTANMHSSQYANQPCDEEKTLYLRSKYKESNLEA